MNADVEKAVTVMLAKWPSFGQAKATITQALRDQEAEIDRLRTNENLSTLQYNRMLAKYERAESRAEKAEALLRKCLPFVPGPAQDANTLYGRITANLGDEHE